MVSNSGLLSSYHERIFRKAKEKTPFQPIFLIGCGRSGTTILGNLLGTHRSIKFLNERRDLWHSAYPEFDIWSGKIQSPILIAGKAEVDPSKSLKLINEFHKEQIKGRSLILLEKLPINSFRLEFIDLVFPQAKYIYLQRNGLEVAQSIEKISKQGRWYGSNNSKWGLIKETMNEFGIPDQKYSHFQQGLIEWRLSMEFSESFFSKLTEEKFYRLSYESLVNEPSRELANIFTFLKLNFEQKKLDKYSKTVQRKSRKLSFSDFHDLGSLGGKHLIRSIENTLTPPSTPGQS